jgi:hypothetical protein
LMHAAAVAKRAHLGRVACSSAPSNNRIANGTATQGEQLGSTVDVAAK